MGERVLGGLLRAAFTLMLLPVRRMKPRVARRALALVAPVVGGMLVTAAPNVAMADLSPRRPPQAQASPAEAAAQRARQCVALLQQTNRFCDIGAVCLRPYLREFPNSSVDDEFTGLVKTAAANCEEEKAFDTAALCASGSNPCQAEICYRPYSSAYPNGRHRDRATEAIATAGARCVPSPAVSNAGLHDGVYNARSKPACGERTQFGKRFRVSGGKVWWEHDFAGITYRWDGTIDAGGRIEGTAGLSGSRASGRYAGADRYVDMHYPQCGPVQMEIGNMLPDR